MALLTLRDIGKIYVSDGNVSVGIRGVNLSFDRGEFVAITGQSGSGKSTLLNVISGMDSYEEGELYIEGQTTSHYLQPDWEEYRQKYISFIFQDYNIIESFTVLQNVELALMHIEDKKERRRRALELLRRVGLSSHIGQKGSRLSGGQKQRTVIARALAKDSPIILADEPTGNLDSTTSAEIIELLREVSRDKLLIVVTHNFEQVEACATRHIRVFDGAVESDHVISRPTPEAKREDTKKPAPKNAKKADFKNGLTLGRTIFTSKPKLSAFLCFLMIVGTLGIFMVTTLCGEAGALFDDYNMFTHIDGRVVLTKQNGAVITEEELEQLAAEYGAVDTLHYDVLLDEGWQYHASYIADGEENYIRGRCIYGKDYGTDIVGRYPTAENEVFLYLPIGKQPHFGKDSLLVDEIEYDGMILQVVGVAYYYDNTQTAEFLFSADGFRTVTAAFYMGVRSELNIEVTLVGKETFFYYGITPSFEVGAGKIYINAPDYQKALKASGKNEPDTTVKIESRYYNYNYHNSNSSSSYAFSRSFGNSYITHTEPKSDSELGRYYSEVMIHPSLLREMAEEVWVQSYRQASLFFADDEAAEAAAERLCEAGYIAVPSNTTYTPPADETVVNMISALLFALMWLLAIVFLAFFINLCSGRTMGAFKNDMAIMRSMGIPVKVIRVGMYVRMLLSLIPAYIFVAVAAFVIFTTPTLNPYFVYLHAWQYAAIFVGMLILTIRTTHKQIRTLFGESVKKSLRGGAAE